MCEDDAPIDMMTLVSPQGGSFGGGQIYDPSTAPHGVPIQIKYTYTDPQTGCTASCVFYITVWPKPDLECPDDMDICVDDSPVSLSASPAGGTFAGPGISGNSFNPGNAGAGTHTIEYCYTDPQTGCEACCEFTIVVHPLPDVNCPGNMAGCVDDPAFALTGATPAGGSYSGTGVAGGFFSPAVAGAGVKTITYTYTDPQTGCSNSCTFTITVYPLPTVTCPGNITKCIDDPAFALAGATPAGGVYSDALAIQLAIFNPAARGVGVHTIYYDYTDPNTGCSNWCLFTITVHPLPVVTCPGNITVCLNDPAFALGGAAPAGGVYSNFWGAPFVNFNPANWGVGVHTIFYDYTDPNTNCSNWCSFTITVLPLPIVNCPPNMSMCIDGGVVALGGGMPAGGVYAGPGVAGGNFNPLAAGVGVHNINYTYTDPATGCSNSCVFSITVIPLPNVTCPGNMTVCEDDLPFILAGATPMGGVYAGIGVIKIGNNYWFNPAAWGPGTVTITYTYIDPVTNCENKCSFDIIINEKPEVECPSSIEICIDAGVINLNGGTPNGGIYSGTGVTGTSFDPATAGIGVHRVYYTYTDPLTSCSDTCSFTVTVNPLPAVTCPANSSVFLYDAPFILAGGAPAGGTYTNAMGTVIAMFDPFSAGTGDHTITYTYTDINGCSSDCVFTISVFTYLDYGDAPDGPYPTLLANNGARHTTDGLLFMGSMVDGEADGQPSPNADGDDLNLLDDEDGVSFTTALVQGQVATLEVVASTWCKLNAWIDYNHINGWADAGEHIFINASLVPGINALSFAVPAGAVTGDTYARFRVNYNGGISYNDDGYEGEVEDYLTFIEEEQPQEMDFGDAPDHIPGFDYHTRMVKNGARHMVDPDVFLGNLIDAEADGQPTMNAMGDDLNNLDDEDGVHFRRFMAVGDVAKIRVKASVDGYLNAWVDFDKNGSWAEAGNQIFTDQVLTAGMNTLTFNIPAGIDPGKTFTRFRFNTTGGLSFEGPATDGEVEDYRIAIYPENWAVTVTDLTHLVVVPFSLGQLFLAVEDFMLMPDDLIGVFFNDQGEDACGGAILWDGTENQVLIAFGDDVLTPEKDGFDEGEAFRFKVHRPSTGETFNVETAFDPEMPNADGAFHNNGMSGLTELQHNGLNQELLLSEGWNGVSTYLEPLNSSISNMFSLAIDDLVILYNMQGVFWPGQNLNTLGNWNEQSGYVSKLTNDVNLTISGNELLDKSVHVNQGWNIIPVLSQTPFDVEMLFSTLPGFVLAKEIAGTGVYLPGYGINTIGSVMPGKAYYVLSNEPGIISYISIEVKAAFESVLKVNTEISSPWNDVHYTPESHVVVFNLTDSPLTSGDVIGAFTSDDLCAGLIEVKDGKFAMTINRDDSYTESKTGYADGEVLGYKLYRPSTEETFELELSYNSAMTPGIFTLNGLSEVVELKTSAAGLADAEQRDIRIFPNPSGGVFNFSGIEESVEITVVDIFGKEMLSSTYDGLQMIDLTGKPEGIYFVRIKTRDGFVSTRKLIVH
jgi:hypothetical protein